MGKPNFEKIIPLLEAKKSFSLTEKQYEESTGVTLPKGNYYLQNKSALSRIAKEYGFVVEVQERILSLRKVI